MIEPSSPLFNSQRRSLAVAIWTMLVAPIGLVEGQPGFWSSLAVILLIASLSALALLMQVRNGNRSSRWTSLGVSIAVPFPWAMLFATAPADLFLFGLFAAALPVCVGIYAGSKTSIDHASLPKSEAQLSTMSEPNMPANSINFPLAETSDLAFEEEDEEYEEIPDAPQDVTQWMKRSLTDRGDLIEGGTRVEFAAGQRETILHVAFCPPFQSIPEVTTEDLNIDDLEIRVAAVFPYGMRLSVRRPLSHIGQASALPFATGRIGFIAASATIRRVA